MVTAHPIINPIPIRTMVLNGKPTAIKNNDNSIAALIEKKGYSMVSDSDENTLKDKRKNTLYEKRSLYKRIVAENTENSISTSQSKMLNFKLNSESTARDQKGFWGCKGYKKEGPGCRIY